MSSLMIGLMLAIFAPPVISAAILLRPCLRSSRYAFLQGWPLVDVRLEGIERYGKALLDGNACGSVTRAWLGGNSGELPWMISYQPFLCDWTQRINPHPRIPRPICPESFQETVSRR